MAQRLSVAVLSGREREDDGSSESTLVVATHCQLCQRTEAEEKLTGLALL